MSTYLNPQSMDAAIVLCVIIILPMIPAVLLFTALHSSAVVTGPFKGLDVKIGGAFAAYFLVLLFVWSTQSMWNPPGTFEVWEVMGTVTDEKGKPIEPLDGKDISISPPLFEARQAGHFRMTFVTRPGQRGVKTYPSMSISHKDLQQVTIDLDPAFASDDNRLSWDKANHTIKVKKISLARLPDYQPTGPAITLPPQPAQVEQGGPR